MSFVQDDIYITHQLVVGEGFPLAVMKSGPAEVRGAASIEGPVVIGSPNIWIKKTATLMVGPDTNIDSEPSIYPGVFNACGTYNHSPYSMHVVGSTVVDGFFDVNLDITTNTSIKAGLNIEAQGDVTALCGTHRLSVKKNFDIPHPSKKGWRLRHTCTEAPYNDVYVRGKLKNKKEIYLPEYWRDFVNLNSITVSLTPIGAYQNIIVKGITLEKIILDSNSPLPVHCFYHIFASRSDGEDLIPEYEGETPDDYPGNNNEYLINKL